MIFLALFLACLFVAIATGAMAAWSDIRGMTIPNLYSVIVLGAFFVAFGLLWVFGYDHVFSGLSRHLAAALIVFVITLIMFAAKVIGAADSKLGTAFALWVGLKGLIPFIFYTSLAGGLLGVAALAIRKWKPFKDPEEGSWIAQVQGGASKVPYGVAIALGALASFVKLGYVGVDNFSLFLG